MSPACPAVPSVTPELLPSNWPFGSSSAVNCIAVLGLPARSGSMARLAEQLLPQSAAPAAPEKDQNIPLVENRDIICPLG